MYSQRDFFYAVLPQDGLPCIAWKEPNVSGGFNHKVFDTVEEMCEWVSNANFRKANYYFCVSTLKEYSVEVGGRKRIRVQQNAEQTRCIVLDIDLKDGHYADTDEALDAVNTLADSLSMPHPIAVSSGNGLHIYWPMVAGIPSKDWVILTKQFRNAAQLFHPHLFADSARVSDSAGLLRIPNTFNLKYGSPRPVEIIQWADNTIDLDDLRSHFPARDKVRAVPVKTVQLEVETKPTALKRVIRNCNWSREYLRNRGEASEPEWYAMLGLAPYIYHETQTGRVLNGADVAQIFSQDHPTYSPDATAIKFEQAKNAQTGPTTCSRFRTLRPERCATCPFAPSVTTPLQAAHLSLPATEEKKVVVSKKDEYDGRIEEETVTIPLYPSPYFRGEDGGVFRRVKKKQEDNTWADVIEPVYDYDLYATKRFRTEAVHTESMMVHAWSPHDELQEFKLPSEFLAEQKKLASFLASKGIIPEFGHTQRVTKYLIDSVRHLQMNEVAEVEFSRFGWREAHGTNPKFVVGNGYIDKTGTFQPASFAFFLKDAAKCVITTGNLEDWKKGFNVYKDVPNSDAFILAALMGFAAPLMTFTPYKGVLYNMVGQSAAGKSTALQVMTSVWGQPQDTHIKVAGGRGSDTEVAMYNLIGYLNAIPVAMDELTNMEPEALSEFALSFTSGRGKMRANREGQNRQNETEWETIVVGTSNTSLYDKLSAHRKGYTAESMRIYQLTVPYSDPAYKQHVEQHVRLLKNNYGHAGRIYINYVIKNIDKIRPMLLEAINQITINGKLTNEERFWGTMFACVFVGGTIAKRLGLHDYDVAGIIKKFTHSTPEVREAIRSAQVDAVSLLSEFFNSNLDGIIKINADGRPWLGADGRGMTGLRNLSVRMELDTEGTPEVAYISIPAFRTYCQHRNIDPAWLSKELRNVGIFMPGHATSRLAAGSGVSSTSIRCYRVDMKHKKLAEVSQDIMETPTSPVE